MSDFSFWSFVAGMLLGAFIGAMTALDGSLTRDVSGDGNDFD